LQRNEIEAYFKKSRNKAGIFTMRNVKAVLG
jgi:hypothetical protein